MRKIAVLLIAPVAALDAQSIAPRIVAADRPVQVVYPSRPTACGDGRSFIGRVFDDRTYYDGDNSSTYRRGANWDGRCVHGPARVVATVIGGEVTRLHVYVGPVPPSTGDVETVTASAADATEWLTSLITRDNSRVASDAVFPLVLADGADPWPVLLRVARDANRSSNTRRESLMWLGNGAMDRLGLEKTHDDTPDDEMRTQAVFILSQRPKAESVPALMDLARSAKYPSVKRSAIFWLGQTGDPRAADVFADLLGLR